MAYSKIPLSSIVHTAHQRYQSYLGFSVPDLLNNYCSLAHTLGLDLRRYSHVHIHNLAINCFHPREIKVSLESAHRLLTELLAVCSS